MLCKLKQSDLKEDPKESVITLKQNVFMAIQHSERGLHRNMADSSGDEYYISILIGLM